MSLNLRELLLSSRIVEEITHCWLYSGRLNNSGYGVISLPDEKGEYRDFLIHRLAYKEFIEEPKNLVLHKVECPNKNCFNPSHLYDGTFSENTRDSLVVGSHSNQWGKTNKDNCKNGHPLSGDNLLITSEGRRRCKICRTEYNKKNWKKYIK